MRVTWVPTLKLALHVGGQLIPAGLLDTAPVPVPARVTVNTGAAWIEIKRGGNLLTRVERDRASGAVPPHAPPQPAKDESVAGVAVSVT